MLGTATAQTDASQLQLPEQHFPQLHSILSTAVQQSPRMLSRALDLEIAENNRIYARSGLLPALSASASYYKSDDRNTTAYISSSTVNSYRVTKTPYAATLTQPLFYWGEKRNNAVIGEIQEKIAQGNYREAYRVLAQQIRQGYLRLILQKTALKRAQFNANFTAANLKQQEVRWAQKLLSDGEITEIRVGAERAQIALEQSELDFQNAKNSFARLSGTPVLADDAIPDSIPQPAHNGAAFNQLLAGFLAQKDPPTLEAINMRNNLEVETLAYKNIKTRLRPKFSAVFGMSQDQQNNLYGTIDSYSLSSVYGGFSVSWSLFDGFATGALARSSLARRRQMENDYRVMTEQLAQDAQTQVKQADLTARYMGIAGRQLSGSEGSLKSVEEEFRRGAKSERDVSLARLTLLDAQLAAFGSRIDYFSRTGDFLGIVVQDPVFANLPAK